MEALREKERENETQFTTKIGGNKQDWVPVISFCKIFIPSYAFDALLCRNWLFSPPKESPDFTDNSYISLSLSQVASTCIPGLRFFPHTREFRDDYWVQISHAISAHCQKRQIK
jgi:hypothetical protein